MYKLCKTEQSAARQRELEKGLVEIMNTMRYEDVTVSDLCEKMNIPRKSFYRYFSSKDGALHALIDHTLMEYEQHGNTLFASRRTLQTDLENFFQFWVVHKDLLDALERSGMSGVLIERAINYSVTEGAFPDRFLSEDALLMRQHLVKFAVCGLMTMVLQWHSGGYQEPVPEMARITARLVTMPLFPDAEKLI